MANEVTDQFLEFLVDKVKELEMNAGYSGAMHDGGSRDLNNQIECYIHGQHSELPTLWKTYYDEFKVKNDPEYKLYQRLKQKFGDI